MTDDSWAVEWRPGTTQGFLGCALSVPVHALGFNAALGAGAGAGRVTSHVSKVEMVSFGVDPQWGGLLFSLCSRHEDSGAVLGAGGGLLFPHTISDSFATSSASPGAAADFATLVGSGYLDVYSMSSVWAIIVGTAKATGMVVLLGVGSLLFYRVYHSIWPRVRSRIHDLKGLKSLRDLRGTLRGARKPSGGCSCSTRASPCSGPASASAPASAGSSGSSGEESDAENSEDDEKACRVSHDFTALNEDAEVTSMYFGPRADSLMDGSTTSLPLAGPVSVSVSARNPPRPSHPHSHASKVASLRRARRRSQQFGHGELHPASAAAAANRRWDSGATSLDEDARDADVSEGSRSPRTPPEERGAAARVGPHGWRGVAPGAGPGPGSAVGGGVARRGWRGWRGNSLPQYQYQHQQHPHGTPTSSSASASGNGTPCSARSTSSSASLSPEYPPHGHGSRHQRQHAQHVSPTHRRSRRLPLDRMLSREGQGRGLEDLPYDPRELVMLRRDDSYGSLVREESLESLFAYHQQYQQGRRRSLSRNDSLDSLGYPRRLPRNESLDSLGFRRAMTRGSSFDSTCSEMSLDASLIAELEAKGEAAANEENPTVACLEQLLREIDQLKSNCLSLDEEFESVKCNRNLPGMSSLLEVKAAGENVGEGAGEDERVRAARARACFAGLYSLTRITSSPSMDLDLSDCQPSSLESNLAPTGFPTAAPAAATAVAAPAGATAARAVVSGTTTPPNFMVQARTGADVLPPTVDEDEDNAAMASLEWEWEEDFPGTAFPDVDRDPADSGVLTDMDLGACAANTSMCSTTDLSEGGLMDRERRRLFSLETSCPSPRDRDSDSMLTSSIATFELDLESELGDMSQQIPELEDESEGFPESFPGNRDDAQLRKDRMQLNLNEDPASRQRFSQKHQQQQLSNLQSPMSPDSCSWPISEVEGQGTGALTRSSSSSGVSVLSRSLSVSGMSDAWGTCSAATTPATPATPSATISPQAVGQRVPIEEYARREWQGDTKKANTMLKGYMEIPSLLGLNAVRVVRGDNYCAVRGALFQALARGLPLPPGHVAAAHCAELLGDSGTGHWLRSWSFAGRLPYSNRNVEEGIRDCLLSLDSTVERLQSASDRESALANMLNADPWLDARLCEAAKLLMLVSALELRTAADLGQSLPLFAQLLFARDSSATPRDLMNNHLRHVGDTAGLEQVEMFLLGFSLGIRIRVVRPSAFGSQDYVCSFPDPQDVNADMGGNVDNRRLVDLVAEDDRHYNVLIQ